MPPTAAERAGRRLWLVLLPLRLPLEQHFIRFLPQKQQHIQLLGVEVQSPLPEQQQELFAVLALPQRRILLCQLVELSPQLLVGVRFPVEFGGLRKASS